MFKKEDLVRDIKELGIKEGELLHLKVSLRAIGEIEGGANTLIEALLEAVGETGTIVCDAFIDVYSLPLTKEDAGKIADDNTPSYAGAFANAMIKHPKSVRSKHPIQKFSAIGALAEELCNNHTPESGGYDLLWDMIKRNATNLTIGGKVIGVGTTHVAVEHMGFKKKQMNIGRNYYAPNGDVNLAKVNWNGGCGLGFRKFIPLYREKNVMIKEGNIGNAHSYYTDMNGTYNVEIEKLKEEPKFFFCDKPDCYSCRMTWEHSDKKRVKFYSHWMKTHYKNLNFKKITNIFKISAKK